ncbi:MAG: hypothetical protein M3Q10_17270 [Chloroflexota bacterium]|nr:hypothetical protein [Chloroflexota bacterium]
MRWSTRRHRRQAAQVPPQSAPGRRPAPPAPSQPRRGLGNLRFASLHALLGAPQPVHLALELGARFHQSALRPLLPLQQAPLIVGRPPQQRFDVGLSIAHTSPRLQESPDLRTASSSLALEDKHALTWMIAGTGRGNVNSYGRIPMMPIKWQARPIRG